MLQSHQVHPTVLQDDIQYEKINTKYTEYTNMNTNESTHWNGPSVSDKPNQENCKNCSSKCSNDFAPLQYRMQHRTVLIISTLTLISRQSSSLRCCLSEEKTCLKPVLWCYNKSINLWWKGGGLNWLTLLCTTVIIPSIFHHTFWWILQKPQIHLDFSSSVHHDKFAQRKHMLTFCHEASHLSCPYFLHTKYIAVLHISNT